MESTIRRILSALGQPTNKLPDYHSSHRKKLSDDLNEEIVAAWNSR